MNDMLLQGSECFRMDVPEKLKQRMIFIQEKQNGFEGKYCFILNLDQNYKIIGYNKWCIQEHVL